MRWKIFQWMNSYLGILQIHENWAGRNFIMNSCIHCSITRAKKWPIGTARANHKFLIAPHIISITFNSSLAMVYFLGRLEVRKGYFSIQVCGKRGNIDNYRAISVISDWQSIWKNYLSIITSLPILSDHSILSKNQNPDSIVLNSIVTAL